MGHHIVRVDTFNGHFGIRSERHTPVVALAIHTQKNRIDNLDDCQTPSSYARLVQNAFTFFRPIYMCVLRFGNHFPLQIEAETNRDPFPQIRYRKLNHIAAYGTILVEQQQFNGSTYVPSTSS